MGRKPHHPPGWDSKTHGFVKFGVFVCVFYFVFFAYKYFLSNVLILKQTKVIKFTHHQSTQERMVSSLQRHLLWLPPLPRAEMNVSTEGRWCPPLGCGVVTVPPGS